MFHRSFRSFRRVAVALSTALCVAASFVATSSSSDFALAQSSTDRGSFVSRLGSSLKKPTASANSPSRTDAVPTPRPLPSQRLAAQAPAQRASQQQSCLLQSSHKIGSADVVEISLEASGQVVQTAQNGEGEREPMEVVAGFKYEERFERVSPNGSTRTIRQYDQAGMKRKFGANVARPLLDVSRKFIVSEFDGKKTTIFSPSGPMKNEQYSLLSELPCNTTILDRLLPNKTVRLGEDWRLPNDVVAALLCVDAIENNTVHLTLTSIVDDFAEVQLYLQGDVDAKGNPGPSSLECASDGAAVSLDLEGKFQFDLKSQRLTWFGLRVDERRSESVAAPGLEGTSTLQIKIAALPQPEKLTDDVVAPLRVAASPELLQLYYNAQKGFWRFEHSRRWKMIEDGETAAALCYVVGGESVAQCNILSNGKIDPASQPSIDGYKAEIKKGLGERFDSFAQEASFDSPDGDSIYYVVADGRFEEVPFRWIYYLITDKDGNQATIMFELRADLLDKYDDSGAEIVKSFRLVPRVDPAQKAAAEKAAADAAQKSQQDAIDANPPVGIPATDAVSPDSERAPSPEK